MKRGLIPFGLLTFFFFVGCSNEPRLVEVEGTVTFKGKAVPKGVVFFDPDVVKQHDGPQGYAYILEGKFTTKGAGRGVRPGPHLARVQGMDGKPAEEFPLGRPLFPEAALPFDIKEGQPLVIEVKR
ncbi:MAG: hypothetical protein EXR99_13965 [Gemmataceae bacterium]|nr:hypothetical protein [Gemmataceae bacterium]